MLTVSSEIRASPAGSKDIHMCFDRGLPKFPLTYAIRDRGREEDGMACGHTKRTYLSAQERVGTLDDSLFCDTVSWQKEP